MVYVSTTARRPTSVCPPCDTSGGRPRRHLVIMNWTCRGTATFFGLAAIPTRSHNSWLSSLEAERLSTVLLSHSYLHACLDFGVQASRVLRQRLDSTERIRVRQQVRTPFLRKPHCSHEAATSVFVRCSRCRQNHLGGAELNT